MKRRKYIYTNKKHSKKAIMAFVLGCISLLSMVIVLYLSYVAEGLTKPGYGVTGFLAVIFSVTGFILGALSFQENDRFRLFSYLGTIVNVITLLMIGIIVYFGMIYL